MMGEKISVIVPVYNVEAYLERCVESILQQTYTHFELILINDGSTDSSGQICDHLAYQYEFIISKMLVFQMLEIWEFS